MKKSLIQVDFESSQEIDIEYPSWVRMLVPKLDPTINLVFDNS